MPFPLRSAAHRSRGARLATGARRPSDGWPMCIHL
ncbi:hypothetical protein BDSB_10240 [Burkholderia dolosa PC543]|nr:hypothetical protein BDSB_10240 [Burkholderia dolosa PC543]